MKKLDSKDAKEIGEELGIDWNKVNIDEFTTGVNIEFEHGTKFSETNVTNNDNNITGKIAWAHYMKSKIPTIYLFVAFTMLFFAGCKKEAGPAGLDGQNATVYYSDWVTPSDWLGASGDWYFDVSAPDLTADIVENGVVLAYVWLAGDLYNATAVRPLPAYAVGANWSFLIHQYETIEFTSDLNLKPLTTGNKFRFIAIPGTITTLKSAKLNNKSSHDLGSMKYKDVCKLLNIPE